MAIQDELQALLDHWLACYARGDIEGAVACFAADGAIYLPYGPPAVGHAALMRLHASWLADDETDKRVLVREARGSGDVAYCVADYFTEAVAPDGQRIRETGTVINVAVRDASGGWVLQISSINRTRPTFEDEGEPPESEA
jgi:ketosteroid isomerase-like protein